MKMQEILNAERNTDTHTNTDRHTSTHKNTGKRTQTHTHAPRNPGTLPVFKAWLAGLP
jgi:hypothetical protein